MPFSLIDDAWIPARFADGRLRLIAPAEIADPGDSPVDVDWGRPDLRLATYELLTGVCAAAIALTEDREWERLLARPLGREAFAARLTPLARFFLLDGDEARFMQDKAELDAEVLPPDALFMDAPGANTLKNGADLIVKRGRLPVLSRPAAAIALYALQSFAPSGGAGHRTSMRGGGPLTTLVVPPGTASLWRRIIANVPVLQGERRVPNALERIFPWASACRTSEGGRTTEIGPEHGTHWLQHYFGMPRRIRLVFEDNPEGLRCALTGVVDDRVVTGFRMLKNGTNYGVSWQHPLTPYYTDKKGQKLPIHPQSGFIGYREWTGYLFGQDNVLQAKQVVRYRNLQSQTEGRARLLAAGYVTDNMKTLDYVEAEVPLFALPDKPQERLAILARELVKAADIAARQLRQALNQALASESGKTIVAAPADRFWIESEGPFRAALDEAAARLGRVDPDDYDAVQSCEVGDLREDWLGVLRRTALSIFDEYVLVTDLTALPVKNKKPDSKDIKVGSRPRRVSDIVEARNGLRSVLFGHGKFGETLFESLSLSPPQSARKPSSQQNGARR